MIVGFSGCFCTLYFLGKYIGCLNGFDVYSSYGAGDSRILVTTDFAKASGAYQNTSEGMGGWWWLRSPIYNNSYNARDVDFNGNAGSRSSVNRTETVSITSGTVTGYSVSFSYAKIVAHTHPIASVSATKTVGSTTYNLSEVTADSNGVATLWVEKSAAINSTAWTVSANNGSVTDTRSATTNSLTAAPDVYPLDKVPIVVISSGGSSWTFKGATIDNSVVKFQSVTSNNQYTGWKGWFKTSCSFKFTYLNVYVDICIVGKGAGGGWYYYDTTLSTDYGGDGGAGGKVVNLYAPAFYVGTTYNVTIDGNGTSIGGITNASAGVGDGAAGGGV